MTRINLLPWREARRKRKRQDFILLLLAGGLMAALVIFLLQLRLNQLIANQEARNQYLQGEIARLKKAEAEIKELEKAKARLLSRLDVIQNLQVSRPEIVKELDAIPRLLPETVYLLTLKSDGTQLTLKGIANSNNAISTFMRNLAESPEFGEPVLTVVENQDINNTRASAFELSVKIESKAESNAAADKPATSVKP
ncbi:MAG: PilN domain-containing protein [Candidatus Competibacteraceae bacterium]